MTNKFWIGVMAVLMAMSTGARAEEDEKPSNWRPFIVGGLTKGGDAIHTLIITGTEARQHAYAGNFLQVGVGALWNSETMPFSLALSLNYHTDDNTGDTGGAVFKRWPIEAIGYVLSDDRKWRLGVGARYVTGVRFEGKFPDSEIGCKLRRAKFDETLSPVAEVGWALSKSVWANFRVVKETYRYTSFDCDYVESDTSGWSKVNGSHVGVNLLYAF